MTISKAGNGPKHRLSVGSRGNAVRNLEAALKKRGLLSGKVDAKFDTKTKNAVKKFERRHDFKANGIVGHRIWKMLDLGAAHDGQVTEVKHGGKPAGGGGAGGGAGAGVAGPAEKPGSFRTVNINVKSNPLMSQARVVHDVKAAAKEGSLIGWNEISPGRYFDAIKDLGPSWGHYMPKDGNLRIPNPISWKKDEWAKLDDGFMKTHGGEAKVSPNRYITWVKLKNKDTGKTIIRMNTHLVSGAWSSPKPTTGWRREMWGIHMKKMDDLITKFEKQGHAVVVGGDFNRDSYKLFNGQLSYDNNIKVGTHGRSTLDYVMSSKGRGLDATGYQIKKNYESDHDAVVVNYKIK